MQNTCKIVYIFAEYMKNIKNIGTHQPVWLTLTIRGSVPGCVYSPHMLVAGINDCGYMCIQGWRMRAERGCVDYINKWVGMSVKTRNPLFSSIFLTFSIFSIFFYFFYSFSISSISFDVFRCFPIVLIVSFENIRWFRKKIDCFEKNRFFRKKSFFFEKINFFP